MVLFTQVGLQFKNNTMIKRIISSTLIQKVLVKLQSAVLKGMNYGASGDYQSSGELFVLQHIHNTNSNKGGAIFDVGGNVGKYTKAIRTLFGDDIVIHAFEPSASTFNTFVANTKGVANLIANNIGIGEQESTLTLYSNGEGSGLASVYDRKIEHYGIKLDLKETISISTIDFYCKKQQVSEILLLKLDIEGHELSAIKGAQGMIENGKIKYIQFECGGTNIDSRTYFKDFFDLLSPKYRIYRILQHGLFEIERYTEQNEVFLSVNYVAILK